MGHIRRRGAFGWYNRFRGERFGWSSCVVRLEKNKTDYAEVSHGFKRMREPLEHIEDCAGLHYRLQLNCYKYPLQKYYGFEVSALFVVCTHPDNGDRAFVDRVPIMLVETEARMNTQKQRSIETDGM